MSDKYGKFRVPIYDYLKSRGFEMTDEDHDKIKEILIKYVDEKTASFSLHAAQLEGALRKSEMWLQRKKQREAARTKRGSNGK